MKAFLSSKTEGEESSVKEKKGLFQAWTSGGNRVCIRQMANDLTSAEQDRSDGLSKGHLPGTG